MMIYCHKSDFSRCCCVRCSRNLDTSVFPVDLPKVNGFAGLNTTDGSVVLNWTRVAGASGYRLSWRHISGQWSTPHGDFRSVHRHTDGDQVLIVISLLFRVSPILKCNSWTQNSYYSGKFSSFTSSFCLFSLQLWRLKQRPWALVSPPTRSVIFCTAGRTYSPSGLCTGRWRGR